MPYLSKEILANLYSSGLSITEIAYSQNISAHKVAYWLKKYNIPTRSISDAVYQKNNKDGDPFKIEDLNSDHKRELFALTIGLFLGEGTKKQKYSVRLANSDPNIISIFLKFLRKICHVDRKKIKAWINLFDDRLYEDSLSFWSKCTSIPKENFYSPVIRARKVGSYKNRSEYGTITIVVENTKLLKLFKIWCDDYISRFADMAQYEVPRHVK